MKTNDISIFNELDKNLLEISINFYNINKLAECHLFSEKCNGCHVPPVAKQDVLIKKACHIVSEIISVLKLSTETLLTSRSYFFNEDEKSILAKKIRALTFDIKIFLLTHSHILSSYHINRSTFCDSNNHNNLSTLGNIFISVINI